MCVPKPAPKEGTVDRVIYDAVCMIREVTDLEPEDREAQRIMRIVERAIREAKNYE
jgi:hypothetical protein